MSAALLDGVAELIAPEAEAAQRRCRGRRARAIPPASGDAERLRQVLLNLTRNAIEAMHGTGRPAARSRPDAEATTVEIDVEDDGPGFSEELPVFDAFFTTKDQGTGLGLSLVHRIVDAITEGAIRVESRPGRTCFTVSLLSAATARSPLSGRVHFSSSLTGGRADFGALSYSWSLYWILRTLMLRISAARLVEPPVDSSVLVIA